MQDKIYEIRKTIPSKGNKYYTRKGYGGESTARDGKPESWSGSVLANCVGYAFGRYAEMAGEWLKIGYTYGNKPYAAQNWWTAKDGKDRGQKPMIGAVACWTHSTKKNYGHVAIVEDIYKDGSWLSSESSFNGTAFRNKVYPADSTKSGFKFQGFIYPLYRYVVSGSDAPLKVGDKVKIIGFGNSMANGHGHKAKGIGFKRKITKIYPDSLFPYRVGTDYATTGFYKAEALKKEEN